MKIIRVVSAVICSKDKIFSTDKDYNENYDNLICEIDFVLEFEKRTINKFTLDLAQIRRAL
ncbi:MAG: hypothetical protein ACLTA8_01155 [Intestinibacter bartlettii]|uniref:Uncharacterized protein n=2 Tax=Anaerococcus TaxID=165779 RepID=A0A7T7UVG6_9FIRM|nr:MULTISPECIES: hypothetical protein [Anaerococcus]MDU5362648.1 hypothetical protein [Finegoldia magna]MDU0946024.1 hypothetical protein [Anaerococcus vaginalis]MDU1030321.1 hypothetical protein [Anaerococcus vaginalis]MDU5086904.1 hypothetical protein [Anaerococcus vaginalis]MDU5372837.1 hypothetical protein [Anaerococcus vaginalis]